MFKSKTSVAPPPEKSVWPQRRPTNYPKEVEVFGGIATPLLAGFSLTTVVLLAATNQRPWLSGWAIAAFAAASALFVFSLQLSGIAIGFSATPAQRLELNPEAATDDEVLRIIVNRQWEESNLSRRYTTRARICYNAGLLAFLAGLGLTLDLHTGWPWFGDGRFIGLAVVVIAVLVEIAWIFSNATWPKWLLPQQQVKVPEEAEADHDRSADYLFGGDRAIESISRDLAEMLKLMRQLVPTASAGSAGVEHMEQEAPLPATWGEKIRRRLQTWLQTDA